MCKRIYRVGTEMELGAKINGTSLHMTDFLRAIVVAIVTDWVFKEQGVSVPEILSGKTGTSQAFEKEARKCMFSSLSSL